MTQGSPCDARSIAGRLAQIRAERRLSAEKFAGVVKAGGYPVTDVTVLAYESEEGTKKIPGDYLAAVARVFPEASPAWLLLGRDEEGVHGEHVARRALREIARLVDEVRPTLIEAEATAASSEAISAGEAPPTPEQQQAAQDALASSRRVEGAHAQATTPPAAPSRRAGGRRGKKG